MRSFSPNHYLAIFCRSENCKIRLNSSRVDTYYTPNRSLDVDLIQNKNLWSFELKTFLCKEIIQLGVHIWHDSLINPFIYNIINTI